MDTDIRFLQELEADLESVTRVRTGRQPRGKRSRGIVRGAWAGVAAAALAISFIVGSVNQTSAPIARLSEIGVGGGGAAVPGSTPTRGTINAPLPAPVDDSSVRAPDVTYSGTADEAAAAPTSSDSGLSDLSKIIRDGEIALTIETGAFRETAAHVVSIAAGNGGSVLSSATSGGNSGTFTLRIPAARFDKTMVQLATLGSVDTSAIHGQDVTAEYIDAKAHLSIYLSRRRVLYDLMAQATTIGQTLTVQNQLEQVQLKIDQITGQLRFLDDQVAESTIKVDIHEPGAQAATQETPIENPSLGEAFSRAIQGFLNVLAVMVIGFGYLIPLLVIAAIAFGVVRLVQRRRAREA